MGPVAAAACVVLTGLFFLLGYISWRTYVLLAASRMTQSTRTANMQATLFRCIMVQVMFMIIFYLIPVSVLIALILFPTIAYSSSLGAFCICLMVTYAPLNFVVLLVLVPQFRFELLRIARNLKWLLAPKSTHAVTLVTATSETSFSRK